MIGTIFIKLATFLVFMELASSSPTFNLTNLHELLTREECMKIFNTADEKDIPKYDVVSINWPKIQKRSLNGIIPLSLKAFNKKIDLNLKLATSLIGSNTPVHYFGTRFFRVYSQTEYPFKEYLGNIYEDEDQLASLTIDIDSNGRKYIHTGIIGLQNVTLHRVPDRILKLNNRPSNIISNGDNYYFVNTIGNLHGSYDTLNIAPMIFKNPSMTKIPDVIYPEILVIIDESYAAQFDSFTELTNYVLNFWSQVDMTFRSINYPKYKLSIAGLAISKDKAAFQFIRRNTNGKTLNFHAALGSLSKWLYVNRKVVPTENYDIAIIQSSMRSNEGSYNSHVLGVAYSNGACAVNPYEGEVLKVGVIYDDRKFGSIYTGSHEVGHTLGALHDDDTECGIYGSSGYIMAASDSQYTPKHLKWSQCTIAGFKQFLRKNPECLFNVPKQYQEKSQVFRKTRFLRN